MSDSPVFDITDTDDLVTALKKQDEAFNNPEVRHALRELLRAGTSVEKSAAALKISVSTAWRITSSDDAARKALSAGDELRRRRLRSKLEHQADEMLNIVTAIARDHEQDGAVRLKAAQDILDRTGLLNKEGTSASGKSESVTAITIEEADPEFSSRLNRIVVRSGTRHS